MLHRLHAFAALAALALISCGPTCPTECLTRCGVVTCSSQCIEFQEAENRCVAVFGDAGFDVCGELNGYEVQVQRLPDGGPIGNWIDEYGRDIAGDTSCSLRRIRLGTDVWRRSAYSHEVRHAIDRCQTPEHEGWLDGGVFNMVEEAQ